MNKLQLYIYKSLRGFKSVRNINPSEAVQSHIRDARPALECIGYDATSKHLFYLLQYIGQGCFFTILRTIPDKEGDHLASTIFIPNGLEIAPEELSAVVAHTVAVVSNPSVSAEDMASLQELFSREYPVMVDLAAMVPSQGRHYARCLYGGSTGRSLDDFFNDRLYQTEFLPYAGIVLVEETLATTFEGDDVTDLSLKEPVVLDPPRGDSDGFTPHLFNHVFDRPFLVSGGTEVEIVWRRSGFEDKTQAVSVEGSGVSVAPISATDARKTISPATFYITCSPGQTRVTGTQVTVNGVAVNGPVPFTLAELERAEVIVEAPGFSPFKSILDLASTTQALIKLHEQRKVFRFELPVKSTELGSPIHFEIHTKRDLSESPLEGYRLLDHMQEGHAKVNHLEYVGNPTRIGRREIILAGCILLAGIVLGWIAGSAFSGGSPAMDNADSTTVAIEQTVAPAKTADTNSSGNTDRKPAPSATTASPAANVAVADAAAIAYLDNNTTWTREGMAKHPSLAGLFDDMNNYRLEALTGRWATALAKSTRFAKVVTHASESARKKIFEPKGTYCPQGDNAIAVQTYLNTIDPAKRNKK